MNYGVSKTGKVHLVRLRRAYYSGMTDAALCGARVSVESRLTSSHPNYEQPAGTCSRCAKVLGQRVRAA
jgi:hypothetical protein